VEDVTIIIENLIYGMGAFAPIFACLLITIESIIPVLPLFTFITINFIYFGTFYGFLISWIFTSLGCFLSYFLVYKGISKWYNKKISNTKLLLDWTEKIKNISMPLFTVLLSMPFTPAFALNIAAALAQVPFKKFMFSVLIGKIFMVYFWGNIGTSFIESFQNPQVLTKISIMLLLAAFLSVLVNKIMKEK